MIKAESGKKAKSRARVSCFKRRFFRDLNERELKEGQ
jgi:hypothetical protein